MCQSSSLRLRNSRPQVTHFNAMGNLVSSWRPASGCFAGTARPAINTRWFESRGAVGRVLVVVVGAA